MAKIVRFHETGGPDVLRVEELAPGTPGAGEVLLSIDAIGLNRAEAAMRGGHYIARPSLPARLGSEGSGRIKAVGDGVERWKVGDVVSTLPLPPGAPGNYGNYATETLWPAASLMNVSDGLDAVKSAATWTAFFTAWGGLVEAGHLAAGEHVIITAASSSVGIAALQVAHDRGAIPIATTRRADKVEALRAAGAAHVIVTEEAELAAEVKRITGGKGVRLIFDPVAGPFAEALFACLAPEGVLMIYGGLANQPATFPRHLAIRGNLTMRGFNFFPLLADDKRREAARAAILERSRDGRFEMPIAQVFALDHVVEAHRTLERNEHVGKIVMTNSRSDK